VDGVYLFEGQRIDGRYLLVQRLGAGGMSVVWRAIDQVLGREVAVKVLAPDRTTDEVSRGRIRAEAQAAARLTHPNITSIHDYGESSGGPDDRPLPFVVMEFVDGRTLADRLRAGRMPWQEAVAVCADVASGLAAAHARGVVHRDVKPSNVMLTAAGAKVVDFGLAGFAGSPEDLGPDGYVYGTPAYLAPERLLNQTIVPATDVYALGLLLYLCLTQHLPWDADTPTQMIRNHQYERPAPLPAIAGLPATVANLCGACLAKDPARRPTAAEAAQTLASVAASASANAALPAGAVGRHRWRTLSHRASVRVAVVAAGALVVTGYLAFHLTQDDRGSAAGRTVVQTCGVTYILRPLGAGDFTAHVSVLNNATRPAPKWSLRFAFRGPEQMVAARGANWSQDGQKVTLIGDATLASGGTVTIDIDGTGGRREYGPPIAFSLDGAPCFVDFGPPPPPPPDGGGPPPNGGPPPDGGPPPPFGQ